MALDASPGWRPSISANFAMRFWRVLGGFDGSAVYQ
jgi:hypothetical protein